MDIKIFIKTRTPFLFNCLKRMCNNKLVNFLFYEIARFKGFSYGDLDYENCLCGNHCYRVFLDFGKHSVLQCKQCKLKRNYPKPESGIYEGGIVNSYQEDNNFIHPHVSYIANLSAALAGDSGKILDFGCGDGRAMSYLKTKGIKADGLEVGDYLRNIAINKGFKVLKGLEEVCDGEFDVVFANHVFEHIDNLNEVLVELKKKIKKNGFLVAAVPNIETVQSRNSKWNWLWQTHYWQFGLRTFPETIERAGFKVIVAKAIYDQDKCEAENFDNLIGGASFVIAVS